MIASQGPGLPGAAAGSGGLAQGSGPAAAPHFSVPLTAPRVSRVSSHGFSLWLGGQELRLRFKAFPWFRRARSEKIADVEWLAPGHLYWPALGVELSEAFIRGLASAARH